MQASRTTRQDKEKPFGDLQVWTWEFIRLCNHISCIMSYIISHRRP